MAQRGTYLRIAEELERRIHSGDLPAGAAVPSEGELAHEFGVARGTVRSALKVLEQSRLVEVVPGRGRYVSSDGIGTRQAKRPYELIAAEIRRSVAAGDLRVGASLPSVAEIAREHGVAVGTIRNAVAMLVAEGVLEVRHGAGTFVRKRPKSASSAAT